MNLLDYTKNVTSQCGEDGIIEKVFEIIGAANKICVEFGAGDGDRTSNTWSLIHFHQWGGVLIEPKDYMFASLERRYRNHHNVTTIQNTVGFGKNNSLDIILNGTLPSNFDLLVIDIDGCDYHAWEAIEKYRPRVVLIEHNPTVPIDVSFIQSRDMSVNQGSSLKALCDLGRRKGYELIAATELNAFFVEQENFHLFDIKDNSPEALNSMDEKKKMRLFQGYDGTLFLVGNDRLIWKNKQIAHEAIQVIPPEERVYP